MKAAQKTLTRQEERDSRRRKIGCVLAWLQGAVFVSANMKNSV